MPAFKDHMGEVFGNLTALALVKRGKVNCYLCKCLCGNELIVLSGNLTRKNRAIKSCGCIRSDTHGTSNPNYRHGHAVGRIRSKTHSSWTGIIDRCQNPKNANFADYGARGITVCDRWMRFENFLLDMGERPQSATIDRIDVNGNYEPSNCKWASRLEQARNTRRSIIVEYKGKKLPLAEVSDLTGINYATARSRIKNGVIGDNIFSPMGVHKNKRKTKA